MTELFALILLTGGVAFLGIAAWGVFRLNDPFLRMHAATKAGTLGTSLVLLGVLVAKGDMVSAMTALAAIVFLFLTLPVAGHLLGRAAYVSGARFASPDQADALSRVLKRASMPLEERLERTLPVAPRQTIETDEAQAAPITFRPEDLPQPLPLSQLLVGLVHGSDEAVIGRAKRIAMTTGAETTALALLDQTVIDAAGRDAPSRENARITMRARLAEMVDGVREQPDANIAVHYEEADPIGVVETMGDKAGLLVLPHEGWFHHNVAVETPALTRNPDGLLAMADRYKGYCLFVPRTISEVERVVVLDDGSDSVVPMLAWCLKHRIWPNASFLYDTYQMWQVPLPQVRHSMVEALFEEAGVQYSFASPSEKREALFARAQAACLPDLPRPLRTNWYGQFWLDRYAKGWRGEVLVG